MAEISFRNYIRSFKSLQGALAGVGVVLPSVSALTSYEPPLLRGSGIIAGGVAGAAIVVAYFFNPHPLAKTRRVPPMVHSALRAFIGATVIAILYFLLFLASTDLGLSPDGNSRRYQLGFGMYDWSLTREGREVKKNSPDATPHMWMMDDALFKEDGHGPEVIWTEWSINTAGTLLVVLFMAAFGLWTFGWSLLARQHALKELLINAPKPERSAGDRPIKTRRDPTGLAERQRRG